MARKDESTEEIIAVHHKAEVRIAQGETICKICRSLGASEQTYYKWRREYGGLKLDQTKRLKELARENDHPQVQTLRTLKPNIDCSRRRAKCHLEKLTKKEKSALKRTTDVSHRVY